MINGHLWGITTTRHALTTKLALSRETNRQTEESEKETQAGRESERETQGESEREIETQKVSSTLMLCLTHNTKNKKKTCNKSPTALSRLNITNNAWGTWNQTPDTEIKGQLMHPESAITPLKSIKCVKMKPSYNTLHYITLTLVWDITVVAYSGIHLVYNATTLDSLPAEKTPCTCSDLLVTTCTWSLLSRSLLSVHVVRARSGHALHA